MHDLDIPSADREFFGLLCDTSEYLPTDKQYEGYVRFNLNAVARGREVATALERFYRLAGAKALDIGAGSGGLAIALAERGAQVSAIEPDQLRRAWAEARIRGHGVSVELQPAIAEQLPFSTESFDVVLLDSVIEHVQHPSRVVTEVCRVLKPGGIVYVVSPNKTSLLTILRDPHYGMLGVVLMPRWLGRWYVEDIRRHKRGYWVNVIPTRRWLRRSFGTGGVQLAHQPMVGLDKLDEPDLIRRHRKVRRLAKVFRTVGLTGVLRRIATSQDATHTYIGVKRSATG